MFNPMQIKHECTTGGNINKNERSGPLDESKYVFMNQDIDCRYRQVPQFWDHTQLSNTLPLKNEVYAYQDMYQVEEAGSLTYVKDYLQHGILFQLNQHQGDATTPTQLNDQFQQDVANKVQYAQAPQYAQQSKNVNQALTIIQSSTSIKQTNRPGRPPKGSSETSAGKKLKCQCEICFKEFGHKSNLFIHMRTHNGERPYKCTQCEKCFTHSGNLAIHMRTHSGERPYGCQICGKMFSHSGNLSTHLRTHSGVKPYKCTVCAKEFRHSGNLSIHERIHSGIKPFQCKVCGKGFYHSGNLTTHMKKHTVNVDANLDQCQNSERPLLQGSELHDAPSLNPLNNITLSSLPSDMKLMQGVNDTVSVKDECIDESVSDNISMLSPRTS